MTALVSRAVALIDEANSTDPTEVDWNGQLYPKEVLHSERMTHWLTTLDPDPTDAQLIAARAHHLCRWKMPRSDYPEGRAGYLRWRKDARAAHAEMVTAMLRELDAEAELVARVGQIISKEGLAVDPQVQTHEDALCLVFLEQQAEAVAPSLGDRAVSVLEKTARKMSDRGRREALRLPLDPSILTVLSAAG